MKMRLRLVGFCCCTLVFLLIGSAESRAQSTLTICNEGDDDLRLAILWQNAPFYPIVESWKAYGWGDISPGCTDVLRTSGAMEAFLAVRKKRSSGQSIMHFAFDREEVRNSINDGVITAERFFCVADEPYDRLLDKLDAHETCPPDYYLQLFNLYVTLEPRRNFKLRLNR